MAMPIGSLVGHKSPAMNFLASAALVAGQVVVREATASNTGEAATAASTTSVVNMLGVVVDAVTYTATPTVEPSEVTQQNIARLVAGPFEVYRFKIAGGATSGTALATTAPANILTNTLASAGGTLITAAGVGSVSMVGGLVKGRSGGNVGAIRKITVHTGTASNTVGHAFTAAIGVNDTFIRVPYSRSVIDMQLTTNFVEANGIIATGTGATFRVVSVIIDEQRDIAYVDVISMDHYFNSDTA